MDNFLEVSLNPESDPRITMALDSSNKLLGIMEFIKTIQFKMDMNLFDSFWNEPDRNKVDTMQLKNKIGDRIRQYYIDLEKVVKLYIEYTLYFNYRESKCKNKVNLEQMLIKLNLDRQRDHKIITNLDESNRRQERYMSCLNLQLKHIKHDLRTKLEKMVETETKSIRSKRTRSLSES